MTNELVALLDQNEVGRLRRDRHGRTSFIYEDRWRSARAAYPLSLSMPLTLAEHKSAVVDAFIWGLLPDNPLIIETWAKRFGVSARNAFALLAHVGEDCAGAVRFAHPDKVQALERGGGVKWLSERDVAERLRALRSDISNWRQASDSGQFSLAGAQPKTALFYDGKRFGVPHGAVPTTHILKPGATGFDGHAENEHFSLSLARELGLATAHSRVAHFEDQVAIVVERYDRLRTGDAIRRVHQEDTCQALAVHPARKYENEGGPGVRAIAELLRSHSRNAKEDIATFVDALAYNWLIAGTDAHSKNYSLLIGAGGKVRLAPLYDLASALPYKNVQFQKLKLAMKIGGKYRVRDIGVYQWTKLALELKLEEELVLGRVQAMAHALPDIAIALLHKTTRDGLSHPILNQLANALVERARGCAALFGPG